MMSKNRPPGRFPHLEYLLAHGGSYLIGDTKSLRGVTIASDSQMVYAALKRREGQSLEELHQRLDEVVGQVRRGERDPVNEMPDSRFYVGRKRRDASKR